MRCSAASRRASVSASERVSVGSGLVMVSDDSIKSDDKERAATDQMFALVGRAITAWSFAERDLAVIFSICTGVTCGTPDGRGIRFIDAHAANAVFFSVENFRARLNLMDAAISTVATLGPDQWGTELSEKWSKLRNKARKLSMRRNRLAHWTVLPAMDVATFINARLVPPYGSPAYFKETGLTPSGDTLQPNQIEHLIVAFNLLALRLTEFAHCLANSEELFQLSLARLARQIHEYDRIDPSRAERLRLAASSRE